MGGTYSKAYQEVVAGRVREDEQIAFFGKNKVATPARTTNFVAQGGRKQPTIVPNHMTGDTGMGKQVDQRDPDLVTNDDESYNLS
jgi:hypothetical protein